MADPKYQHLLLRLLSMWEARLAKLEGRRPRTFRGAPTRAAGGAKTIRERRATNGVTKSQYLRQRVERAVRPLENLLHESDLRFIKMMLEERFQTDPYLAAIAERATRPFR